MEDNQNANELKVVGNEFDPQLQEKLKQQREFQAMRAEQVQAQAFQQSYYNPREYFHSFLLQAQQAGHNCGYYIEQEIEKMLAELKR